jgi:hypothetical protein
MKLSIRQIIFIAVSNYLSDTQLDDVRKEIGRKLKWSPNQFIGVFQKHIDLELLRTHPVIKEDILIYNYLMYEAIHKENVVFAFTKIGDKKMKFYLTRTISKYETEIILPQLNALKEANKIINGLID